jgi:vacuolar-type H+-ATPase subunit F/Vma7
MYDQEIHVLGYQEIIYLFGLLGIDGTILKNSEEFLDVFNNLIKNPSIGMIIIALNLPTTIVEFLFDFKLNKRRPFIFFLLDQNANFEADIYFNEILKSINKIIF